MAYNELEKRGTDDFPVEFFHIDKNHPRYYMSAHWHNESEIIRILDGRLDIVLDNRPYTATKGDVLFVNPETIHQAAGSSCIYECIVFHTEFLQICTYSCSFFIDSILKGDCFINEYIPNDGSELNYAANEIFKSLSKKSSGYKFRTISSFYKFLGIVVDKHCYANKLNETVDFKGITKLKGILAFIRENYDKRISLGDIAEHAGISPKYLGTFFKSHTGKAPIEYLNEYRVEKAAQKLLATDAKVTDIAYDCGFDDLSYFIKTFKKIKQSSPGQFRKLKSLSSRSS